MSLTFYFHPLSSYCQKALIALYETGVAFEPLVVDLGSEASRSDLLKIWPMGKFPVLHDSAGDRTVPESSIIIEYLAQHYPGRTELVPADPDLARQTRMRDRFYDQYVMTPMQKVVTDRLRPDGQHDSYGVDQARDALQTAYGMIEQDMATMAWAMGEAFTMADCAAAPALFYANLVAPLAGAHPTTAAYLDRLMQRPSYARAVREAEPFMQYFPR